MKKIIKQTEKNLNILKEDLQKKIKEKGPAEIGRLTNSNGNSLSDWYHGRIKMAYEKILRLSKEYYKVT